MLLLGAHFRRCSVTFCWILSLQEYRPRAIAEVDGLSEDVCIVASKYGPHFEC
jgi:hypothetical protein